jgi:hypothetical protein
VFGVGAATRIYVATGATDMRKGFNGLYGLVRDQLLCDPLSGHLLGCDRPVGMREKTGEGAISLADGG